jgi:aminoglycoside phosphotransferase (APT) family kinase protein
VSQRSPLLSEPHEREKKPLPSQLPKLLEQQIETLVGARITGVTHVSGGLSVSAAFVFALDNGQKIFVKGAHPGDTAHATKNLEDELKAYKSIRALKEIAPRYIGLAGGDGWVLGIWEHVDHDAANAAPARAVSSLAGWQRTKAAALHPANEHIFISQFLSNDRKWQRLRSDDIARKKFLAMFERPDTAQRWLDANIVKLCRLQERVTRIADEEALIHGDLRLDNFLFGKDKTWVIDWPNACRGPRALDPVFLFSNLEALGFGPAEEFFTAYGAAEQPLPPDDVGAMLGALSGYFADQAYRDNVEKMPRLRWMQKSMLLAQLRYMGRLGLIESPPKMSGEKQ